MAQNFEITRADDADAKPVKVRADARDALVWERTNRRGRTAVDLASGASVEDQYDLAYHAGRRLGLLDDVSRKDFDAGYLVDAVGEDEDEDPTKSAA